MEKLVIFDISVKGVWFARQLRKKIRPLSFLVSGRIVRLERGDRIEPQNLFTFQNCFDQNTELSHNFSLVNTRIEPRKLDVPKND